MSESGGSAAAHTVHKGRGAVSRPHGRYETRREDPWDDGWGSLAQEREVGPKTQWQWDKVRRLITSNDSPDVGFSRSINPYRGCEHGCVYCFARPSHAYLGLSPGLDFETRLFAKENAAEQLRRELANPRYRPSPIALGINTDAYQILERRLKVTRSILEVLHECSHPVSIITKSALVERDLDLLAPMAQKGLVQVMLSITTLDAPLALRMEPRTASPQRRLRTLAALREAGVPAGVMVAPVIPGLSDHELEHILEQAAKHGALQAGYVLLRLPHELREVFRDWLNTHAPGRTDHVFSLLRQMHGGRTYNPQFGNRMRGTGVFADLLASRFRLACRKLKLDGDLPSLRTDLFRPCSPDQQQLALFNSG